MIQIKDRLYELMTKLHISQADMIKATNIPKSSMSMYLAGTRIPKADKISLICNAYGVNEVWLMGYEDVPMMKNGINDEVPKFNYDLIELIDLYSKITDEQKKTVLAMLRSFVS